MIVCHCKAVSDREVRAAIRAGATRCGSVARACGAGSVCGGCGPAVKELIAAEAPGGAAGVEDVSQGLRLAPSR